MQDGNNKEQDRVFSLDEFKQFDRLSQNANSRIPVFFCVDVSGSMNTRVTLFETRLSLLTKVMRKLLEGMKTHPELSERAVIGVVTYNNTAVLQQPALDLGVLDIQKATSFDASNQTVFSRGLRRTLQAIDQYKDSILRSDVDTFTPILVFMTDGQPVGDDDYEIQSVYRDIWSRIQNNDLFVFPIGISDQAKMMYVSSLRPDNQGFQMRTENDFFSVFEEIANIVNETPDSPIDASKKQTHKVSKEETTRDTGIGSFDFNEFDELISAHYSAN